MAQGPGQGVSPFPTQRGLGCPQGQRICGVCCAARVLGAGELELFLFVTALQAACGSPFCRGETEAREEHRVGLNQVQLILKPCNEKMCHCKLGWGQGRGAECDMAAPWSFPGEITG